MTIAKDQATHTAHTWCDLCDEHYPFDLRPPGWRRHGSWDVCDRCALEIDAVGNGTPDPTGARQGLMCPFISPVSEVAPPAEVVAVGGARSACDVRFPLLGSIVVGVWFVLIVLGALQL